MITAVKQEIQIVDAYEGGFVKFVKQDIKAGNSWRKREAADGCIDWRMSSRAIYNLVRSLTRPYVGAHFIFENNEYKVWRVEEIELTGYKNIEPGKVIGVNNNGTVDIKAYDNLIRLVDFDAVKLEKGMYLL